MPKIIEEAKQLGTVKLDLTQKIINQEILWIIKKY